MVLLFCEVTEEGRLCSSPTKYCRNFDEVGKKLSGAQCIVLPHVLGNTRSRLVKIVGTVEGDIEDVVSKNHMPYA